MNFRLILYLLGIVSLSIGACMGLSMPWAFPLFGGDWSCERSGFIGLTAAMTIATALGGFLWWYGKKSNNGQLLRKETMAVVPLSWILAILLGALPYWISGTEFSTGQEMSFVDAVFESTSGFTTTGATVLSNLENPKMISRSILFWRATTNFLGGLGIMVLFVLLFGQGIVGKMMMNVEKGSGTGGATGQIREIAYKLARVYIGLIILCAALLMLYGVSCFDAVCHAFSVMSSSGFSNYNNSIGHFAAETTLNDSAIELTLTFFMFLAGSNFVFLYFFVTRQWKRLIANVEWRVYIGIIIAATGIVFLSGIVGKNFDAWGMGDTRIDSTSGNLLPWTTALRYSLFQVVSTITGSGFCVDEYELWNSLALLVFVFLMFVGGCAGSTAGGTKIFRNIVAFETVRQEAERIYRPNIVRTIKVGSFVIEKEVASSMVTYLFLFLVSVFFVTFLILLIEPSTAWDMAGVTRSDRMIDVFSASLSAHSNVGPGFGLFGAKHTYSFLSPAVKLILAWSMLLGRLEIFLPYLLFSPSFWKNR